MDKFIYRKSKMKTLQNDLIRNVSDLSWDKTLKEKSVMLIFCNKKKYQK